MVFSCCACFISVPLTCACSRAGQGYPEDVLHGILLCCDCVSLQCVSSTDGRTVPDDVLHWVLLLRCANVPLLCASSKDECTVPEDDPLCVLLLCFASVHLHCASSRDGCTVPGDVPHCILLSTVLCQCLPTLCFGIQFLRTFCAVFYCCAVPVFHSCVCPAEVIMKIQRTSRMVFPCFLP